jgi:hypothetical protein
MKFNFDQTLYATYFWHEGVQVLHYKNYTIKKYNI